VLTVAYSVDDLPEVLAEGIEFNSLGYHLTHIRAEGRDAFYTDDSIKNQEIESVCELREFPHSIGDLLHELRIGLFCEYSECFLLCVEVGHDVSS
jgi:hypothetical protein